MIYTAKEIQKHETELENPDGSWTPARPLNYICDTWKERLFHAWGVLTGKFDVLDWED